MEFALEEHRTALKELNEEHADEDDYKDDAPAGIEAEYKLQLKNMEFANANSKKWGSIAFEDTPEYFYGKMHKGTNPA